MRRAFSLVELSIVLVILGLLTGGILAGRSLIRASELRSVATDMDRYMTSIQAFRGKYFALPGDMPNAVSFWGAQAGGTADGYDATCGGLTNAQPAAGIATCNGDGDNIIAVTSTRRYEYYRLWQHLANAGLIEGSFTGVPGTGSTLDHDPGINCPKSRIPNAGHSVYYKPAITTGNSQWWDNTPPYHVMYMGGERMGNPGGPALRPEEVWNYDTKRDDGLPASGRVLSFKSASTVTPDCTTSDDAAAAAYNLASTDILCAFVVKTGF